MTGMLILINILVLVVVTVVNAVAPFNIAQALLGLPAGWGVILRPWTLITYMFTQTDVLQAVFNMLWFYWFGTMLEHISSRRRLLTVYILSGIGGGMLFMLASAQGQGLEGASSAVMGVVALVACSIPNHRINLFLLGEVKVKWIGLVTILIFSFGGGSVATNMAHAGGVIVGLLIAAYSYLRRPRYKSVYGRGISTSQAREELDMLLDKVKRSGYNSLTANERRRLIELSHRI